MIQDRTKDWFVANVRDLRWQESRLGATGEFDKHRERFDGFGIDLTVLRPRQPMTMYHREGVPGGIPRLARLTRSLIVEGQEVPLRQWDYFHCPADVAHGDRRLEATGQPARSSAVGSRVGPDVILYPRDETALKHSAGVEQCTRRHLRVRPTARFDETWGPRHPLPPAEFLIG